MITGFLAGTTLILALNSIKLWFDTLELNSKLREAEFQVSIVSETIERLIEERKNEFTSSPN